MTDLVCSSLVKFAESLLSMSLSPPIRVISSSKSPRVPRWLESTSVRCLAPLMRLSVPPVPTSVPEPAPSVPTPGSTSPPWSSTERAPPSLPMAASRLLLSPSAPIDDLSLGEANTRRGSGCPCVDSPASPRSTSSGRRLRGSRGELPAAFGDCSRVATRGCGLAVPAGSSASYRSPGMGSSYFCAMFEGFEEKKCEGQLVRA